MPDQYRVVETYYAVQRPVVIGNHKRTPRVGRRLMYYILMFIALMLWLPPLLVVGGMMLGPPPPAEKTPCILFWSAIFFLAGFLVGKLALCFEPRQ